VRCRYCGQTLTDPVSIAAGAGPVCREKFEGRYCQETIFSMSDAMIRNNRDAAAYEDRRQHMIANIDNPPRAYTAVDLLSRLGETVEVWHTKWECDMTEAVFVAIVKDGLMLGRPNFLDWNDECWTISIDEFNEKCRFKNNAEAHHGS